MNLKLFRTDFRPDGIFGELTSENGLLYLFTLEHSYQNEEGAWLPKIPEGTYQCIKGQHELEGQAEPFETFEVTRVPDHTGILFHKGNLDKDSEGCILIGLLRSENEIINSAGAFSRFMNAQKACDSFTLTVVNG